MDVEARIEGLRRYLIHSDEYVVIYYSHLDDPETVQQAQLSVDALPKGLAIGETVLVTYLIGIVAAISRVE